MRMNRYFTYQAGLAVRIAAALLALTCRSPEAFAAQKDASAPRAEIQINLCSKPQDVIQGLALQPDGAAPTQVWYFDTPGLELARRGLVFRLRQGDRTPELTLKVAGQDCTQIKPARIPAGAGKCEYDNHGALFSGTVSLMHTLDAETARVLTAGRLPLEKALSPAQIAYLRDVMPAWPLTPGIRLLGPIKIQPYHAKKARFDVNVWTLPAGETYIEISEKAAFKDVLRRRAELLDVLSRAGIAQCPDQAGQGIERLNILLKRP